MNLCLCMCICTENCMGKHGHASLHRCVSACAWGAKWAIVGYAMNLHGRMQVHMRVHGGGREPILRGHVPQSSLLPWCAYLWSSGEATSRNTRTPPSILMAHAGESSVASNSMPVALELPLTVSCERGEGGGCV